MSDSVERTTQLLFEAQKATEEARGQLAVTEAQLAQIDDIHIEVGSVCLPKTNAIIDQIEANVQAMHDRRREMADLIESIVQVQDGIKDILDLEKRFEVFPQRMSFLDKAGKHKEALEVIDALEKLCDSKDFGQEMNFQKATREIVAWSRVSVYIHMGEANIKQQLYAYPTERLDELDQMVDALPERMHPKSQLEVFHDRIRGFRCLARVNEMKEEGNSYASLNASLNLLEEILSQKNSALTQERIAVLYSAIIVEYNALSTQAFDEGDEYKDALAYFNLRGYFKPENIAHEAYRESVDEDEFKIRFYLAYLTRIDEETFAAVAGAYGHAANGPDCFEMKMLSKLFAREDLSPAKVESLKKAFSTLAFQDAVWLAAMSLEEGIATEIQIFMLEDLSGRPEKRCDLDATSKAFVICREKFHEALQKPYEIFLKDILRSPHAHKVAVKSNVPETHMLYGESREDFRKPWGKPVKDPEVKAWTFSTKGLYYALAIVLPILLVVVAFALVYMKFSTDPFGKYYLVAPFAVLTVYLHFIVCGRFGRDERGSGVYRKLLGVTALIQAAIGLLYFILPTQLAFFEPIAYTMVGAAAFEGLAGVLLYKDKKRALTAIIYVALLLTEAAAIVLLIMQAIKAA